MSAAPLPWQSPQWQRLESMVDRDRMPHAILLRGNAGVGKECFARAMSFRLLCRTGDAGATGCGSCQPCLLLKAGSHPDVAQLAPLEDGKSIGIDQVRALVSFLSLTAKLGRYKLALVHAAELMTVAAANSLLKVLEEPPGDSVLMLISHRSATLLPTIVSRCQVIDFPSASESLARIWLEERLDSPSEAALLLAVSYGRPLTALSRAEEGGIAERTEILGQLRALFEHQADPVQVATAWAKLGVDRFAHWATALTADMIRLKMLRDPSVIANSDLVEPMQQMTDRLDLGSLFHLWDIVTEQSRLHMTHAGLNEQSLLEAVALAWNRSRSTNRW